MKQHWRQFILLLYVVLASALADTPTPGPPPLTERVAQSSRHPTDPQNLSHVFSLIRDVFRVPLSQEAFPKQTPYADTSVREEVPPFRIDAGETFGSVMKRVVAVSDNVYRFEVIRGTPVLRPNPEIVKTPNLLDTVVDLEIEDSTIWDALCVLARAVNRKVLPEGGKALYVQLNGPQFVELPAPVLLQKSKVSLELEDVSAREALCAIFESAHQAFWYFYYNYPDEHDYVVLLPTDSSGAVIHGPRVRDVQKLDDWSDENIANLQSGKE
jgi:hypothetical protein